MSSPGDAPSGYERVLRPRQSILAIDWARLVQYRDLLWVLVRRDFVARYQQTVLGPLWFVLQPLVTTAAFTLIFSRGLGTSTDGIQPAFLFYQCGMLVWGYFSAVLGGAGNTFQSNAAVFTKVYFPRLIMPLAVVIGVNLAMSLFILPRMDTGFLAEPRWGGTTLSAVGGVWSVVTALACGIATVLAVSRRRIPKLRESVDAGVNASVLPVISVASLVGFGAVIDAVARLLPGALGDERSNVEESFTAGLLDWPHYTRPEVFEGLAVPPVLLSGNHADIRRWRLEQAVARTRERRPELLGEFSTHAPEAED